MNAFSRRAWLPLSAALVVAVCALGAYSTGASAENMKVILSGEQEVPPVKTMASGSGTITVDNDMSVRGSVTTKGIEGTAAHIHLGAIGANGGVIIPLAQRGADTWTVPAGAKLTESQYDSFKSGDLYVNVHTKAHPGGEIRGQLSP